MSEASTSSSLVVRGTAVSLALLVVFLAAWEWGPGLLRIPIIRQLFSSSNDNIEQTDIVMLLTPRIVRTQELTVQDVSPIFIGSQQSLGLGGPPPLIGVPPIDDTPGPAVTTPGNPLIVPPATAVPVGPGAGGPAASSTRSPSTFPIATTRSSAARIRASTTSSIA